MGQGLTHRPGGRGTVAHHLPWGKGLVDWWAAWVVSSEGMDSWAAQRVCNSAVECKKNGKSAVLSVAYCRVLPAAQRREG